MKIGPVQFFLSITFIIMLTACTAGTPTASLLSETPEPPAATLPPPSSEPPTAPPPTDAPPPATELPTSEPTATSPEPTPETPMEPPEAQRIEFVSEDQTQLVGTYLAAMVDPAPAVILMHQFGSDRSTWERNGLAAWLQNPSAAFDELWPQMPPGLSFGVFYFDFRGHGESGGNAQGQRADFLMDARSALATMKELPGVDPERIVLIGASIGADAAIDVCLPGCLGALSLSPGGYLGVPYAQAVEHTGEEGVPAWCLAAEDDPFSADTCESASAESYRGIVYPRGGHGETLLRTDLDPDVGQVVVEFLTLAFGLAP